MEGSWKIEKKNVYLSQPRESLSTPIIKKEKIRLTCLQLVISIDNINIFFSNIKLFLPYI